MRSDSPLKIGLLGLGRMGRNHLRVLSLLAGVELTFVYDIDGTSRSIAEGMGLQFADDLDEWLSRVDAVVICTPTLTHGDYFARAAKHVRNIFVEKPLTETLQTSLAIQDQAQRTGLNVQVGFIERYNPAVIQMGCLLERSDQVVSVDFVRTNKISARITDVDVVTDLMIHDIDLALYMNGPVTTVAAHGASNNGMIDFASALLTHENGRFSRIQASRITDKKMRSIQATCTDMFIDCDLLRKEINLSRQSEVHQQPGQPYVITAISEAVEVPPQEALVGELQEFVRSARSGETSSAPGVSDAVSAMRVCEAVRTAIQGDR